jgi:hypothetical protein
MPSEFVVEWSQMTTVGAHARVWGISLTALAVYFLVSLALNNWDFLVAVTICLLAGCLIGLMFILASPKFHRRPYGDDSATERREHGELHGHEGHGV